MKKILFSTIYIIFLISNSVYATDNNKTMSNDEFMKKWKVLEQREKVANEQIKKIDEIQKTLDGIKKKTSKN